MAKAVFGIAHSESQAVTIVERLRAAGFSNNDISVLFPDRQGTSDFAVRSSISVLTSGNIMRMFPDTLARNIARSCVRKMSSRWSEKRRPRMPRNGFRSMGVPRYEANLSPPTSSVRNTTGRPGIAERAIVGLSDDVLSEHACRIEAHKRKVVATVMAHDKGHVVREHGQQERRCVHDDDEEERPIPAFEPSELAKASAKDRLRSAAAL
jgi:hypothetical protein